MQQNGNMRFRISVSKENYSSKPQGANFAKMSFQKEELNAQELLDRLCKGHAICYLFNAAYPIKTWQKKDENYIGTQVFFYDFDHYPIDAAPFIESLAYKPTFAYKSYSYSESDFRFRLVYVFEEVVYGISNFEAVRDKIAASNGFDKGKGDYDKRPASQMYFGSTSDAAIMISNMVYSLSDFEIELKDNDNKVNVSISSIEDDFWHKSTTDFLSLHKDMRQVHRYAQSSAMIDTDRGYFTYPEHYFEITRTWHCRIDKETGEKHLKIKRVPVGERKKYLFARGMVFKVNKPDINYPELLYCLTHEVYHYFINNDGKINKQVISDTAKSVMKSTSTIQESKKGKFKVNKEYWSELNVSVAKARGMIRGNLNREEFYRYYDSNLSVSENLEQFKVYGYNISKATVYRYLKDKNNTNEIKGHISHNNKDLIDNNNIIYNETDVPLDDRILEAIRNDAFITAAEIAKQTGVSEKTIKRKISVLKDENRLIREGSKKNGKWAIVK